MRSMCVDPDNLSHQYKSLINSGKLKTLYTRDVDATNLSQAAAGELKENIFYGHQCG